MLARAGEVRGVASAAFALPDLVDGVGNVLVETVDELLLLLHAEVRLIDALVQRVVLAQREVRRLAVVLELLGLGLLILEGVTGIVVAETKLLQLQLAALQHLGDQRLDVLRRHLPLHLGPDLHYSVLELDLECVGSQIHLELLGRLRVDVHNVVQGHLVRRLEQVHFDVFPRLLHVRTPLHHLLKTVVGELEAANGRLADEVGVRDVLDHERLVV